MGSRAARFAAIRAAAQDGVRLVGVIGSVAKAAAAPGTRLGVVGGDILLTDADGNPNISGADYAKAFVDEIERPAHRRQRFSVAY
jgi:hypothetical protein